MTRLEARERVAALLRDALSDDGRTTAELASSAGISGPNLLLQLQAEAPISVDELAMLASALGVDIASLVPASTTAS